MFVYESVECQATLPAGVEVFNTNTSIPACKPKQSSKYQGVLPSHSLRRGGGRGGGRWGGGQNVPNIPSDSIFMHQPQVIPNFPTYGVYMYISTQSHIMYVDCPVYPAVFL